MVQYLGGGVVEKARGPTKKGEGQKNRVRVKTKRVRVKKKEGAG